MASSPSLPPKKQSFYDSATEESVPPPPNQQQKPTTGATTTAQLSTNPSSPHSGKPRRGAALRYPNAPYLWWVGGYPSGYTSLRPMVRKRGTNRVMRCRRCTGFVTLPLLNMEKEEHLRDHLDNLTSLKARRIEIERREDI
jgi:hypothetical protein